MSTRIPSGSDKSDPASSSIVLALNSGSSSLKFGLYCVERSRTEMLVSGLADCIGDKEGKFHVHGANPDLHVRETMRFANQEEAIVRIVKFIQESNLPAPDCIGHRFVHGGPKLREHCIIDDAVIRQLDAAVAFAPLHLPSALTVLRVAREHFPNLAQVACFDTAFHAQMTQVAHTLPIPDSLRSEGIERYGFHGLSCESIVRQLDSSLPDRLVIAHLGNGSSITAVSRGISIDTSMGLTPSGGVIMGTRSGDLDPGLLIYLMREKNFSAAMIEDLVNHRSGLLGISGISGDMRSLREVAATDACALLAIQMFCYSVRKQLAAMTAVLNGVDMIVFTGGIGENDAQTRALICSCLSWIGINLDELRNRSASNPINDSTSRCTVLVLASQEDEQIARHSWALSTRAQPVYHT